MENREKDKKKADNEAKIAIKTIELMKAGAQKEQKKFNEEKKVRDQLKTSIEVLFCDQKRSSLKLLF